MGKPQIYTATQPGHLFGFSFIFYFLAALNIWFTFSAAAKHWADIFIKPAVAPPGLTVILYCFSNCLEELCIS